MSASTVSSVVASAGKDVHCASVHGSTRSVAGRLWMAMLTGSALMFGAMMVPADAAEPAPVEARTRPPMHEDMAGGAPGHVLPVVSGEGVRRAGRPAPHGVSGRRSGMAQKPVNRASAARGPAHGVVVDSRAPAAGHAVSRPLQSRRLSRPAVRAGLRKITSTGHGQENGMGGNSVPIRLSRAEQGVVQHISRTFRVQQSSIEQYVSYARRSGEVYHVDPYLILAVMATESSFNPRAQSRVGAQGLMQVHTRMHKKRFAPYGSTDAVWEPRVNILVGSSILSDYLKRYGGSERRALQAYVGAARLAHDGGYGRKVLRRRDEFVSVSTAARTMAASQARAAQADGGSYADL